MVVSPRRRQRREEPIAGRHCGIWELGGDLAGRPWTGRVGERVPHIRDAQMLDGKVDGPPV